MFLGTFEINVTDTNRIALPIKIRKELGGERFVLTVGFEECVLGYKEKEWEEGSKDILSRSVFYDKEARDIRRKTFSEAEIIKLDSQGRFVMPERMVKRSEMKESVLVIGAGDHFEIWDKTNWEEYRDKLQ
ncbi:division/cell wall cluster transcriptional repressor MraZ [Candidatus Gottesmanbacteria bacterium RIFCSPHIGHO2_02_FULL_39_11]|uniref:Transcriptional regulator MraZ n=1 Tax=Candidatus Gottesmanbacteria bacterium RIFCSPHIGHO2_02_FULL_39_11 TaxID=1798382 RepID=A0A1F5ZUW5_9BACT|nr:MAG: division/cell wall cluster transcriptional repressor MraZ [Candidatus Gottesmanbacteria bacterium RIFCSPHIGHO2_02_FULL_39_11]